MLVKVLGINLDTFGNTIHLLNTVSNTNCKNIVNVQSTYGLCN